MTNRYVFISSACSKTGILTKDQPLVRAIQSVLLAHQRALQNSRFVDDCNSIDGDVLMDLLRGGEFYQEALNPEVNVWLFQKERIEYAFLLFSVLMQWQHPPQADPGDLMDLLIVLCQGMTHSFHIMGKLRSIPTTTNTSKNLVRYLCRYSAGRVATLTGWELLILYTTLQQPGLPDPWRDLQMQIREQTSIYRKLFIQLTEVRS